MVTGTIKAITGGALCSFVTSLPSFAFAEENAKGRFGAWDLHCETPAGATSEQCALTQSVRSEDKPDANLGVIIARPRELKNTAILRVLAPLSVYLLNGVALKIDQTDVGRAPFFRCSQAGCLSDIPVDEKLLALLKGGKILTLVIYLEPSEGLRHQVRLEGFKEGYEKLR